MSFGKCHDHFLEVKMYLAVIDWLIDFCGRQLQAVVIVVCLINGNGDFWPPRPQLRNLGLIHFETQILQTRLGDHPTCQNPRYD